MKRKESFNGARKSYTVPEAAFLTGLGVATVYRAIDEGMIPHIRVGRRIVIPRTALDRWLETCGASSSPVPPPNRASSER